MAVTLDDVYNTIRDSFANSGVTNDARTDALAAAILHFAGQEPNLAARMAGTTDAAGILLGQIVGASNNSLDRKKRMIVEGAILIAKQAMASAYKEVISPSAEKVSVV